MEAQKFYPSGTDYRCNRGSNVLRDPMAFWLYSRKHMPGIVNLTKNAQVRSS